MAQICGCTYEVYLRYGKQHDGAVPGPMGPAGRCICAEKFAAMLKHIDALEAKVAELSEKVEMLLYAPGTGPKFVES